MDSLKIDIEQLPQECAIQAHYYYEAAKAVAEAEYSFREAEAMMEACEAELDAQIRSKPEEFGLSKLSEEAIKKAIQRHPSFLNARGVVLAATKTLGSARALERAMEQRRTMLSKEVDLLLSSAWTGNQTAELPKTQMGRLMQEAKELEREIVRGRTMNGAIITE